MDAIAHALGESSFVPLQFESRGRNKIQNPRTEQWYSRVRLHRPVVSKHRVVMVNLGPPLLAEHPVRHRHHRAAPQLAPLDVREDVQAVGGEDAVGEEVPRAATHVEQVTVAVLRGVALVPLHARAGPEAAGGAISP